MESSSCANDLKIRPLSVTRYDARSVLHSTEWTNRYKRGADVGPWPARQRGLFSRTLQRPSIQSY